MKALIVCKGDIKDYSFYKRYFDQAELIICVDGAAYHLRKFRIKPHVLIGDFDSIEEDEYDYLKSQGVKIKVFPTKKDEIDTELAVAYAMESGCSEIILIGALGSRFDHTLASVHLLKKIVDGGIKGWIINENNQITLINDRITLKKEGNEKVSLLPLTEKVEGITTKGLYYSLNNATLEVGPSRGVSNEFSGEIKSNNGNSNGYGNGTTSKSDIDDSAAADGAIAEITVKKGLLLVIKSKD